MKRSFLPFIFILLFALCSACSGNEQADTPTNTPFSTPTNTSGNTPLSPTESPKLVALTQTYTNEAEGFTFKYPDAWKILSDSEMKDFYGEDVSDFVIVCLGSNRDKPEISSYVSVNKFQSSKAEIDEMLSSTEAYFEGGFADDVVIHDLSDMLINEIPVRKLTFTVDYGGEIAGIRYFYAIGSAMYRVDFECPKSTSKPLEKFFDAIMDSYKITRTDGGSETGILTVDEAKALLESSLIAHQVEDVYLDAPSDNGDSYLFNIDVFVGGSHSSLWVFVSKETGEMQYSPTTAFFDDPTVDLYPLDDWYNKYSTSTNNNTDDEYGDEYYQADNVDVSGGFVTYINDGFMLSLPSNAKLSSQVEKEAVNQFSISNGAEVPTEKIYKIEFIWGVADVKVQVNIFPNNGAYFSTTNITVPNADGAYLQKNISDSILETSKYELKVIRGDLLYILETTYNPSVALMGQAKGQSDFSYERELLKELLSTFEIMINSFALTDNPVSFENIGNSGTLWQKNVTDLSR